VVNASVPATIAVSPRATFATATTTVEIILMKILAIVVSLKLLVLIFALLLPLTSLIVIKDYNYDHNIVRLVLRLHNHHQSTFYEPT